MLETLVVLALLTVVIAVLSVAVPVWALKRRMRVVPGVRTRAPLHWLVVPTRPARLQRRLRSAVLVASADPALSPAAFGELVVEIRREAVQLDRALVVAGRTSGPLRRAALGDVADRVTRLEDAARRVARLTPAAAADDSSGDTLAALEHRLDMIESAIAEIDQLETRPDVQPGAALRR